MSDTINQLTGLPVSNENLREVVKAAERLAAVEQSIRECEEALDKLKDAREVLSTQEIPDLMLSIGLEDFTLTDGTSVTVSKFYSGKITEEHAQDAFEWFRKNGHGSLVKREVKLAFGMGQDKQADKVVGQLVRMGLSPADKTSVHPQTLKAFIKEQMEEGNELPADLLGVYVGNVTKLTPAK